MKDQDLVNHPQHYTAMKVQATFEPIDLCRKLDFSLGNCLKYLFRYKHKGTALLDLKKAQFYLNDVLKFKTYKKDKKILSYDCEAFRIYCENSENEFLNLWNFDTGIKKNLKTLQKAIRAKIEYLEQSEK